MAFFVYVDYLTASKRPFYVGKGTASRVRSRRRGRLHREFACRNDWYRVVVNSTDSETEAFRIESELISYLRTRDHQGGANRTDGGEGISGHRFSAEARERMSSSRRGRKLSVADRAAKSAAAKIAQNRPEVIAKQRAAKLGKPKSEETRERIANARRGTTLSAETRARVGAARLGKKATPEHRANIAAALRGKKKSPQHVANSVDAKKRARGQLP